MLVTGGRPRRVRAISCSSALGIALALVAASCGGRTSALDLDAFDPDGPGGGGTAAFAGSSSVPVAGTSPSAGTSSGGGGSIPEAVPSTCQKYCAGYAQKCLIGIDCVSACIQEMTSFGAKCQKLGLGALKCLTPFFQNTAVSCDTAVASGLAKCSKQTNAFTNCKGGDPEPPQPQPNPQPNPMPMPMPMPTPYPGLCPGVGEESPYACKYSYSCLDGVYTTSCTLNPGGYYDCSCYWPNGSGQGFGIGGQTPPCVQAAQECGFIPPILK